jgi:quercetin dioxygenase-like cupin family protein
MSEIKIIDGDLQLSMIQKVTALENEMRKYEQIEIPVKHYFSQGVYAREITIPKDCILTGKIHKYTQLNILSKGEMTVVTENGTVRVKAPFTIVSPPGTKRAAIAHEECVWTTIHGTDETDVEKIEKIFIAKDENDYLEFTKSLLHEEKTKCLG